MTPFERPEDFARSQMMRPEVSLPLTQGYVDMLARVIAARDAYIIARVAAALEPAGPDDAAHDPIARVREVLREAGWPGPMAARPEIVRGEPPPEDAAREALGAALVVTAYSVPGREGPPLPDYASTLVPPSTSICPFAAPGCGLSGRWCAKCREAGP